MRLKINKTGSFRYSKKYLKMIEEASVYDVAIDSPTTHAINLSLKENPQIEGFIQKMRDKAHNISKKNSLKRMSDAMKTSFLDDIIGIGKIKKMRVINFFGNVQNLKHASKEELRQIKGLNSKNIKDILDKING